MAIIYSNLQ